MSAHYRDCPVCGACESVQIDLLHDGDDVHDWDYPDVTDVACGCILSQAAYDAILLEFQKWWDFPWHDDDW